MATTTKVADVKFGQEIGFYCAGQAFLRGWVYSVDVEAEELEIQLPSGAIHTFAFDDVADMVPCKGMGGRSLRARCVATY